MIPIFEKNGFITEIDHYMITHVARDQVDFLASQGCDMIQGYFYAKPMPAMDFEVRMNERYKPKSDQQ